MAIHRFDLFSVCLQSHVFDMLTIFDCDGVLVDSEVIALETLSNLMTELGHPMSVADCRDAFMGRHNDDIWHDIERRIGRPLPGGGTALRQRILDSVERTLEPVDGVAAALARLDGPRCVASSSDRQRIVLLLEWTGLDRFFGDRLFSGMDVPRGKPAPDLFLHVAKEMQVAPSDCVVVEDSVMGVAAGVSAGMRVVGFTGGRHTDPGHADRLIAAGAETIVAHMSDLPPLLAAIARSAA